MSLSGDWRIMLYAILPWVPPAHSSSERTCSRRSLVWWLGWLGCFHTRGCLVAVALAIYFAATGKPLLAVFGEGDDQSWWGRPSTPQPLLYFDA